MTRLNENLVAHWPLAKDAQDALGRFHGQAEAVRFGDGPMPGGGAAWFDGRESRITVPDDEALRLGAGDFTFAAWVRCADPMTTAFGDVLTKFDPTGRYGLNLWIAGSAPAYSGMSDQRHVHFGVDDGYTSAWEDLGKPEPTISSVTTLATWQGRLYAGISSADTPERSARVFRYVDGQQWEDCGRICDDHSVLSVMSMLVHDGNLYAGSGNWDWQKAKGAVPDFTPGDARVYRYEGGTTWRDLGAVGSGKRILCMASFNGSLYAGLDSGAGEGKVFRLSAEGWQDCGAPDGRNLECLLAMGGELYAATHGRVYRYAGDQTWTCLAEEPFGINQIHCMAQVHGQLWIGTWPQGYVLRLEPDGSWTNTGRLGIPEGLHECNEVMDLRVHQGKLYAALIPKSQVWRYEADGQWTLLASLASRPDFIPDFTLEGIDSWCRITSFGAWQGRMLAATASCRSGAEYRDPDDTLGRVHASAVGSVASHETDIGRDWVHLAGVRQGQSMRLYVNGRERASVEMPPGKWFDLSNTQPLLIGAGAQGSFAGGIADVRLYGAALDEESIAALAVEGRGS